MGHHIEGAQGRVDHVDTEPVLQDLVRVQRPNSQACLGVLCICVTAEERRKGNRRLVTQRGQVPFLTFQSLCCFFADVIFPMFVCMHSFSDSKTVGLTLERLHLVHLGTNSCSSTPRESFITPSTGSALRHTPEATPNLPLDHVRTTFALSCQSSI
jgi:hypothetical protein